MATEKKNGRRAVVVGGVRTPVREGVHRLHQAGHDRARRGRRDRAAEEDRPRAHKDVEAIDLGRRHPADGARRTSRARSRSTSASTRRAKGMTVTRACASGLQAITARRRRDRARRRRRRSIAGGSDSTSNATITLPPKVVHAVAPARARRSRRRGLPRRPRASSMPISEIFPRKPKIAERTTGEVMGESAERMAKRNEITREAQDEFAVRSHHRAAAAIASGRFDDEIVPVQTPGGQVGPRGRPRARGHERREAREAPARSSRRTAR